MTPKLSSLCRGCSTLQTFSQRSLSTTATPTPRLRRAMLYVPGSNPRMLEKSFASPADSICYDLEDAVALGKKVEARKMVCELLNVSHRTSEHGADGRAIEKLVGRSWLGSMLLGQDSRMGMLMRSYVPSISITSSPDLVELIYCAASNT